MKKRIWAMTLAVVLALSLVPVSAAGSPQEEEGAQWITVEGIEGGQILFNKKTGVIEDSQETVTVARVPSQIENVEVTCIAYQAFSGCDKLTMIEIPETVIRLGKSVFYGCVNLEKVVFHGRQLELIGGLPSEGIFQECDKLASAGPIGSNCNIEFNWKDNIPSEAFCALKSLTRVILPDGVQTIGEYAFVGCENLSSIEIPNSVTSIEQSAFFGSGLEEIVIPEGVSFINAGVFSECKELQRVTFSDTVRGIGENAFSRCEKLTEIVIPGGVNIVEAGAFRECNSLAIVTLPREIMSIGGGAFSGCKSLADVYYRGSESDWGKITIGTSNDELVNATIHYGTEDIEEPVENTLTFETNGGSKINSLSVSADTTVDLTQYVPVKEGYTFAGWYSDSKLTSAVTSLKLTADATVYAKWLPAQYTLTFETNGGSKITPLPVAADITVDLTKYVPTKEGYAFAGWYADRNLTTQVTALKLAADTTVYAKWLPAQYTLTFETNGGSKINALSVGAGTTVDLTQYVPVRAGYDFAGWYADRKLTTQVIFLKPTADTTVYAKWEKEAPVLLPFLDVTKSDWFYEDVAYVYENGLMNGMGEGQFGPQGTTTRGMIVTILYRQAGSPAASGNPFADVDPGQYYAQPIAWAASHGIVNGISATTFAPDDPITREQMATILYRYARYQGEDVSDQGNLSAFADADTISAYAKQAMAWANGAGLINGVENNRLNPTGQAFRSQVVAILHRFCTME